MSTNKTDIAVTAKRINDANKKLCSQSLTLTAYSHSVLSQPKVDFSGFDTLTKYQEEINAGLDTAQSHARTYLNTIQPSIITNISNIENYYALHKAVATTLPPGSSTKQWIDGLTAIQEKSAQYASDAKKIVTTIKDLEDNLITDETAFAKIVIDLNAAVKGDKGVLASIDDELGSIQSKIDWTIAGIAGSALAAAGGVFLIAVGSVANFVTAGTSTPLVIGGVALVTLSVGGAATSGIMLAQFNKAKASLLTQKSTLNAEVNLAQGISSAYGSLKDQVSASVTAANGMQTAWQFLYNDLNTLVSNLKSGIDTVDSVRTLWLTAANYQIQEARNDIRIIKGQMTGEGVTGVIKAPKDKTISDIILQAYQAA